VAGNDGSRNNSKQSSYLLPDIGKRVDTEALQKLDHEGVEGGPINFDEADLQGRN